MPAQTTPRTNWALKAGGPNTDETRDIKGWREHWDTQDREYKNGRATRRNAPKWRYAGKLRIASVNVRSMREITKREQLTTYMKNKGLDIVRLQEIKIPSSSLEQRGEFTFVFASSSETGTDYHGVGICYRRNIDKYRNHYIQHTSHLAEIEKHTRQSISYIFSIYTTRRSERGRQSSSTGRTICQDRGDFAQQERTGTRRLQRGATRKKRGGIKVCWTSRLGKRAEVLIKSGEATTRRHEQGPLNEFS